MFAAKSTFCFAPVALVAALALTACDDPDSNNAQSDAGSSQPDANLPQLDASTECPADWRAVGALPFRPNLACVEPWLTHDSSFEGIEGYNGEMAFRIWPPSTGEGVAGVGQFNGVPSTNELHVGFLYRIGSTLLEYHGNTKQLILWRTEQADRPMIIWSAVGAPEYSAAWRAIGPCDNTLCQYGSGEYHPDSSEPFRYGHPDTNAPGAYGDEWVWFEYVVTSTENQLQIWTQDGAFQGEYVARTQATGGHPVTDVDCLGGYWSQGTGQHELAYYDIGHIVLSDEQIGPPW